jgi:hypothetical protein
MHWKVRLAGYVAPLVWNLEVGPKTLGLLVQPSHNACTYGLGHTQADKGDAAVNILFELLLEGKEFDIFVGHLEAGG